MNIDIKPLIANMTALKRSLVGVRGKQVKSVKVKSNAKRTVQEYFGIYRPRWLSVGVKDEKLADLDTSMQELLRSAQKDALKTAYAGTIKAIIGCLHQLELLATVPQPAARAVSHDSKQSRIIETLTKLCPSSAISYEQALMDLRESSRKSWRGTAVEFRESLRELLDVMASDNDVMAQQGFRLEGDAKKPTMKQKTVFILKSRQLSASRREAPAEAAGVVDLQIGKYVRSVYDRSSVGTHTQIDKKEAEMIGDYVTLALADLLETGK